MRLLAATLLASVIWLLAAAPSLWAQARSPVPPFPRIENPEKEGRELAAALREAQPAEARQITGALKVRRNGQWRKALPLTCRITPGQGQWQVAYETTGDTDSPAEAFAVVHAADRRNEYWFARAAKPGEAVPPLARVTALEAARPFAGTDYALIDLGLEFFQWPTQRVLRFEMRRSCVCRVLESVPPPELRSIYSRVLSWIDRETGGVVAAEAYDARGRVLKDFSIRSLKKVEGQWQLKDMDIRTVTNNSLTRLEFELKANSQRAD